MLHRRLIAALVATAAAWALGLRIALTQPCADRCFPTDGVGQVCIMMCTPTWSPWRIAIGTLLAIVVTFLGLWTVTRSLHLHRGVGVEA